MHNRQQLTSFSRAHGRWRINRCQRFTFPSPRRRNLEHQACGGGVREQAALGVRDPRFRGCGAPADIERAAFGTHHASILSHAADKTDLEFERGVAGPRRQHRMHGKAHRRIQQGRGVAAMHRADRVVMPEGRDAVDHDHARLGRAVKGFDGLHDRRRRQFAVKGGADEIDPGHRCHDFGGRHAVFDLAGGWCRPWELSCVM